MDILVIGATGYVASRVIPELIAQKYNVHAGARNLEDLDKFWWRDRVSAVELDVLDDKSVSQAFALKPTVVLYLVHAMAGDDFESSDRTAARRVVAACDQAGVEHLFYLSGVIPSVPPEELSAHLRSRLEVEEILNGASATVTTLRAGMVIGAGSTSFELMRQLALRLPVTVVPQWMESLVEPIAITDLCAAILGAIRFTGPTGYFDVGCGQAISYPDLISMYLEQSQESKPQLSLPFLPESLVAKVAGWISDVPSSTVESLIESLQHDMGPVGDSWVESLLDTGYTRLTAEDAITRALATPDALLPPSKRDPIGPMPGDPQWAGE